MRVRRRLFLLTCLALPASALAADDALQAAIRQAIGDRAPQEGGIAFTAPRVAENGAQVPVTISVESAMAGDDRILAIHLFATANPTPGITSIRLHPGVGRAEVQTRIRLAQGQRVLALAEHADGRVLSAAVEIGVTSGGCLA